MSTDPDSTPRPDILPTSAAAANTPSKPVPVPEPDIVTVPTYSSWFRWDAIHEVEYKHMQEFFDGKSPSKNPTVYKYYRNAVVKKYRTNPSRKITFTEVRRTIVGDVGSIRRVFDFLDTWGLVNYSPPAGKQPYKWEDKEKEKEAKSSSSSLTAAANAAVASAIAAAPSPAAGDVTGSTEANASRKSRKWCSGCKTLCTIACFVSDKYDLVLCARCYVRGNYRVGVSSTEFRRVEISEPAKTEWTEKETLHLLEAVMHYGDDWKRVAEHVGGRSEKDCVARFIKLPFGEQYVEPAELSEEECISCQNKDQNYAESGAEPAGKRLRLTPLADASNPIMAQAAFLSALAGVEVSEAAARAAVATLYDMDHPTSRGSGQSQAHPTNKQELAVASSSSPSFCAPEEARVDAEFQLKQEEDEFIKSISTITEVKIKEILDKIARFEDMNLQLEREWHELHQMKHQLFIDKLTLLFHKTTAPTKAVANVNEENARTELSSSS